MLTNLILKFRVASENDFTLVKAVLCWLTARQFADDSMSAISAGVRLPQAAVALDQEAGV